jgi:hypothetical protein
LFSNKSFQKTTELADVIKTGWCGEL